MERKQAEREIVEQIKQQWDAQTNRAFICWKRYPATIRFNNNERKLGLFKKKSGGALYAESLDVLIYGPVFTIYKVAGNELIPSGERNLFAHTKEARKIQIDEFETIFN